MGRGLSGRPRNASTGLGRGDGNPRQGRLCLDQPACLVGIGNAYTDDRKDQLDLSLLRAQNTRMHTFVAGAGIAGLAAAIAMRSAGHDVVVAEKASELHEIGAALSLWPNAIAALTHLGLAEEIRAVSVEAPTASILRTNGTPLVKFDTDSMRSALGGLPVVVLRADLQGVLLEACRRLDIEVRLSEPVASVTIRQDQAVVTTKNAEAIFDAVIGADGINSTVRATVVDADDRRACNRTAWRAVIANQERVIDRTWLTVGPALQLIASPTPHGLAYWAADTPKYHGPTASSESLKEHLLGLFGGWHQPIPGVIEQTPAESLIVTDLFDRPPPKRICQGPVVLVGDASHAMTPDLGQGACQALEDAAVLLACAQGTGRSPELFSDFERRRLRHVRTIVRDSHAIGRLATVRQPLAARLRDLTVRATPEWLNNRRLSTYASTTALRAQIGR